MQYLVFMMFIWFLNTIAKHAIIISHYEPHIICTPGQDPSEYAGVDLLFAKELVTEMHWNDSEVEFICTDWEEMFEIVYHNHTNVIGAIAGITIKEDRLKKGFKFSQPYIDTGVSLIVQGHKDSWQFLNFFTKELIITWITINIMTLSVLTRWFEGSFLHIIEYIWHSAAHMFVNGTLVQRSYIGKYLDWCQLIMNLIFSLLFTSMVVQRYAYRYDINLVTNLDQTGDKIIGSFQQYEIYVYNIEGNHYPIDAFNPIDVYDWFQNTTLDGVIMDDPILQICQSQYADFYIVSRNFINYGFGVILPPNTDDAFIKKISQSILKINERYPFEKRLQNFIKSYYTKNYDNKPPLIKDTYDFYDFYELWLLYAGSVGISSGLIFQNYIIKKIAKRNKNQQRSKINPEIKVSSPTNDKKRVKRESFRLANAFSKEIVHEDLHAFQKFSPRSKSSIKKLVLQGLKTRASILLNSYSKLKNPFSGQIRDKRDEIYSLSRLVLTLLVKIGRYYESENFIGVRARTNQKIASEIGKTYKKHLDAAIKAMVYSTSREVKNLFGVISRKIKTLKQESTSGTPASCTHMISLNKKFSSAWIIPR